jgi:hypothetical protein
MMPLSQKGVLIHLMTHESHRDVIAAAVIIVRSVKWLVEIANKMDDVLKGGLFGKLV